MQSHNFMSLLLVHLFCSRQIIKRLNIFKAKCQKSFNLWYRYYSERAERDINHQHFLSFTDCEAMTYNVACVHPPPLLRKNRRGEGGCTQAMYNETHVLKQKKETRRLDSRTRCSDSIYKHLLHSRVLHEKSKYFQGRRNTFVAPADACVIQVCTRYGTN